MVAGCRVVEGAIRRTSTLQVMRDGTKIHEGHLLELKVVKNAVDVVRHGSECGIAMESFSDFKQVRVFVRKSSGCVFLFRCAIHGHFFFFFFWGGVVVLCAQGDVLQAVELKSIPRTFQG